MIDETNFLEDQSSEIIYSVPVVEFVTVANECCKLLEHTGQLSKKDFVMKSHKLLAFVYLKASVLPEFESVFDGIPEKFVSEQDWEFVKYNIANKLVSNDVYVDIPDPLYPDSDETTSLSLSECIADIYQDLKDFTTAYSVGAAEIMNDSLWECKQNFRNYWGLRLLIVMQHLHVSAYGVDELAEESAPLPSDSPNLAQNNWFTNEILTTQDDEGDEF